MSQNNGYGFGPYQTRHAEPLLSSFDVQAATPASLTVEKPRITQRCTGGLRHEQKASRARYLEPLEFILSQPMADLATTDPPS
jgi:hypothetical protein